MLSAYEEQRAANIRQNNARLRALGLEGQRPAPAPRSAPAKRRRPPAPELAGFVRRTSGRNAARVDYKEASLPGATAASKTAAAGATAAAASDASAASNDDDDGGGRKPQPPAVPFIDDRPEAEERTTRAVSVALPELLKGVGELVDGPCTKEAVVSLLSGGGRSGSGSGVGLGLRLRLGLGSGSGFVLGLGLGRLGSSRCCRAEAG
jgi:hypothetical protein